MDGKHPCCHERYDAVIHLVSAAIGAEEFYTTENNEVRHETPEQAADLDRKVETASVPTLSAIHD